MKRSITLGVGLSVVRALGILGSFSQAEAADGPTALVYNGGPVISPDIVPIYWGPFTNDHVPQMQSYLQGLVDYMNAVNFQSAKEPTLRQYGVWGAALEPPVTDPNMYFGTVNDAALQAEIAAFQSTQSILPYASQRIFLVFTEGLTAPVDYGLSNGWCARHAAVTTGAYYAHIPFPKFACNTTLGPGYSDIGWMRMYAAQVVFEMATDPNFNGWRDAQGREGTVPTGCNGAGDIYSFGPVPFFADNKSRFTNNGTVSCDTVMEEDNAPLTVISPGYNKLDVFFQTSDHQLGHKRYAGAGWEPVEYLGGIVSGTPSAVTLDNGTTIHVVVRGSDGGLYDRSWTSSAGWTPEYVPLGGYMIGSPSAIATGTSTFEVYVRGFEGVIYRKQFNNGSWNDWSVVDGSATAMTPPTLVHRYGVSASDLELFWTNLNGLTKTSFLTDFGWTTGAVATGLTFGRISPVSRTPGQIDVWVTGTDGFLYQSTSTQVNSWTGWQGYALSNGILVSGSPFASSAAANSMNVFTRASNGNPRSYSFIDGQAPTAPVLPGGATVGSPVAVSFGPGRLDVFLRQTDAHLRHYWGDGTTWWGWESFADTAIK
jgi:hypothetical protein